MKDSSDVAQFEASEESTTFVRSLYQGILRREPDDSGLKQWSLALEKGLAHLDIVNTFIASAEFQQATAVKLFVPIGHFYSPIVNPQEARPRFEAAQAVPVPKSVSGVKISHERILKTWRALLPFFSRTAFPASPTADFRYGYQNPSYSWGDGAVLQAMIRLNKPKKIIEIGCGWSSGCIVDTVENYLDQPCDLTFVDPDMQLFDQVVGTTKLNTRKFDAGVQDVPLEIFDGLGNGDILFIDSTHILRTGSDVCRELFDILPRLKPGVLVHIHDMFWPFEYPFSWVIDENRSWNELYAVRAFLTQNEHWEIVMFNDYMAKLERPLIETTWPDFLKNPGGALWLQRK